jgi:phosphate transport system substrate-binding protein
MKKYLLNIAVAVALTAGTTSAAEELMGGGATFPYPLYSKMFSNYHKATGVKVNYQSIGSGGGVRQIFAQTVDFGATDGFVKDDLLGTAPGKLLHIPIVLGSVAVTYNLPGFPGIKISSEVLAGIYLGKINKWNDPALQALNPGIKLPNQKIIVVSRSDGSGTTEIFTDYLSKVSSEWKTKVGSGKSINWPTGLAAKGNEGVSGMIKQMPGSLGYAELAYTIQNKLSVAKIQNQKGNFIAPSLLGTSLAAEGAIPEDTRVSLTNPIADQGYPIAGFTWVLVYAEQNYKGRSQAKAKALADLLWWMVHEGQQDAEPLHYAKLPSGAISKTEKILKSMTYNGKPLLP